MLWYLCCYPFPSSLVFLLCFARQAISVKTQAKTTGNACHMLFLLVAKLVSSYIQSRGRNDIVMVSI